MVIEYVGDLVRPCVADAREKSIYNSTVGAGTYVFSLNKDYCVDATRSGNIAHLLNHSCNPNCYSRTIPVWDHVIIFAKRDIDAWEELSYDYRFCGEEQLVCNCGAVNCRGAVNQPVLVNGFSGIVPRGTMVPLEEVKFPFRQM